MSPKMEKCQSNQGQSRMNAVLRHALKLAEQGKPVFPCKPGNKAPYIGAGFKAASTEHKQIENWWKSFPAAMIGMPTGGPSGIWALDVDIAKGEGAADGRASLVELTTKYGSLPPSATHSTPSGGKHYLFRYPVEREVRNSTSKIGAGLDIRGDGGYIIMPPSINAEGRTYEIIDASEAAEPPEWLLDLVAPLTQPECDGLQAQTLGYHGGPIHPYVQAAVDGELKKLSAALKGTRNDTLNTTAFALGQWVGGGELSEDEAQARLFEAAQNCGLVDDGKRAVSKTIESGLTAGKKEPRQLNSEKVAASADRLPPPPQAPLEAFPPQIAALLQEASEAFAVSPSIPVACLLALVSCLVGGSRRISLKDSWKEPGNIWIAIVADSGIGKTPCAAAFFEPVKILELKEHLRWKEEYASYENELELCNKERASKKKGSEFPDKPIMPKKRQVYVDDATVESLGEIVAENPRGVMWWRDELSGLIADMDKYSGNGKGGGTRSRLLSSYGGAEWKTSRTSNPARNLYIPHAYVGIFGGIQPAMLSKVFDTGATGVDEASGFLQRFLLIRAERETPSFWTERSLSTKSIDLLDSIAKHLWDWDVEFEADGLVVEKIVSISNPAKKVFIDWYNEIAGEEFLAKEGSIYSKLKGQAQRLCLLLHCLESVLDGNDGMRPVSEDTMRRALLLVDWAKENQTQCWRFFNRERSAKQATPIEKAIMQAALKEAAKIEADGWKISNEQLFKLAEKELGMSGLSHVTLGKAAAALGLPSCAVNKGDRGRIITAQKIDEFKTTVGSVGNPFATRVRAPVNSVGQP